MSDRHGGIGGGSRVDPIEDAVEHVVNSARPPVTQPVPGAELLEQVTQANAATTRAAELIEEAGVALARINERLDALEAAFLQLHGQVNQIEVALPQHRQAIQTLDARMTEMAQQIARNVRLAVLDVAARAKGPGEGLDKVGKAAAEFLKFVEPEPVKAPEPEPPADPMEVMH